MKLYKVLDANGRSCHGGDMQWSLPTRNDDGTWTPGEWMPDIEGELVPCENGYHLCREDDLLTWLQETIWIAEIDGDPVEAKDKVVSRRVRLISGTAWNERIARLFACDCAERVLHIYEREHPGDGPRKAIETARRYANGEATWGQLLAAGDAAWAAAWDAAGAAAWDAARAAARAAAWAAARAAAWAAARDAARAAARHAEKNWQTKRLLEYLEAK